MGAEVARPPVAEVARTPRVEVARPPVAPVVAPCRAGRARRSCRPPRKRGTWRGQRGCASIDDTSHPATTDRTAASSTCLPAVIVTCRLHRASAQVTKRQRVRAGDQRDVGERRLDRAASRPRRRRRRAGSARTESRAAWRRPAAPPPPAETRRRPPAPESSAISDTLRCSSSRSSISRVSVSNPANSALIVSRPAARANRVGAARVWSPTCTVAPGGVVDTSSSAVMFGAAEPVATSADPSGLGPVAPGPALPSTGLPASRCGGASTRCPRVDSAIRKLIAPSTTSTRIAIAMRAGRGAARSPAAPATSPRTAPAAAADGRSSRRPRVRPSPPYPGARRRAR